MKPGGSEMPDWRKAGLRYYSVAWFLRNHFGEPVRKVTVDAGFGCPNRDGTVGKGGCIFCSPASYTPGYREGGLPGQGKPTLAEQIRDGIRRVQRRHKVERFLVYFQPGTNTYGPVEAIARNYREAIAHPQVVGLILGTRPDCLSEPVLDLLGELARSTWIRVELGLQTIHERFLAWMNRGHDYSIFPAAVAQCRERGLEVGAHVILGLPGETDDERTATVRELARLKIDAVKLHNLHAVHGTPLAEMAARGEVELPRFDDYVRHVADFLERLHADCVVDRLAAEVPVTYLAGPAWCANGSAVREAIVGEMERRNSCQGDLADT